MLMGEASPYLSPLYGSLSVTGQNSPEELLDFQLEQDLNVEFGNEQLEVNDKVSESEEDKV